MRIVAGRGDKRQEWEISARDYADRQEACLALFEYVKLPVPYIRRKAA